MSTLRERFATAAEIYDVTLFRGSCYCILDEKLDAQAIAACLRELGLQVDVNPRNIPLTCKFHNVLFAKATLNDH